MKERTSAPSPWLVRLMVVALLLGLAGLAFGADLTISRAMKAGRLPGTVREILRIMEAYGHAVGVTCIILTIACLDPRRGGQRAAWVAGCSLGGGILADAVKLFVERTRPRNFDLISSASIWDTFGPPFPIFRGLAHSYSMPSAHTATAFGLTVALSTFYPRGRALFALFGALVGCQRIQSLAHFPSDVLVGAAVGLLWGWWLCDLGRRKDPRTFEEVLR